MHKFSYVPVPGRGLFFSATYQGKKDINSRTFQFLAGAFFLSNLSGQKGSHFSYVPVPGRSLFFSQQFMWTKRTPFLVLSSSWQGPFFLSNLSEQKGHTLSYVPVPGRGIFFSAKYLDKKDPISRTFQFLAAAFFSQQFIRARNA